VRAGAGIVERQQTMTMNVIDHLEQTPNRVRELIAGRCEEDLSFRPSPHEFSLRENLLHLRDIDVEGYEVRIIGILTGRLPEFPESTVPCSHASGTTTSNRSHPLWKTSLPPEPARLRAFAR
jgi:hypothetical protein